MFRVRHVRAEYDAALEEARRFALDSGELLWLPEIHRVRGDLLAASPGTALDGAERELVAALELARRAGAAALEQRATASLDALRTVCGLPTPEHRSEATENA